MNLKQLAKELNLSISTVSKALRDSHEISINTKEAVLLKAKELNYQVNPFASSLRKQKSKTIAVVIPEVANNFFALAINGIESIAQEKGYHVLIYLTHEDNEKEIAITKHLQNGRVDGIMMSLSGQTSDINHLVELKEKEIPIVFFDRVAENIDVPKVTTDDYNSGIKSTEHLIENGCKRIAFLSISQNLSISNKRMNGYLEALKINNIKPDNNLILSCNGDEDKNYELIRKLLKRKNRPDGIFASVEKLAISTYEICKELELNIPKDIKIISFSNLQTAALLDPSLTTITQPAYEIGREAALILFKLVEKRGYNFLLEKTVLKSTLIQRNSTKKTVPDPTFPATIPATAKSKKLNKKK
jgi:LacI family transcriptional regulator